MSEENVDTFRRLVEDASRRDAEALVVYLSPEVEWHPALLQSLEGAKAVYRGHEGVRELISALDEAFGETNIEIPDVRSLGDSVLGLGHASIAGRASGAHTQSPFAFLIDFQGGRPICVRTYLDHERALKAAGLSK